MWSLRRWRLFSRPRSPDDRALRRGPPSRGDPVDRDSKPENRASRSSRLLHYCLAITSIVLASILTLLVPAIREGQHSILLLAAVVASTCYGGQWPGLLATIVASIASTGFLLLRSGPRGLEPNDWIELGVFVLVALGTNTFAAERSRAVGLLRRSRDDLERRVGVRTSELLQANKALQAGTEVRQRAEEALSQFAAIEASTEDAVLALRVDGTIVSCNPASERLYGRPTAELVGRPIDVLFPREAPSKMPHLLERVSRGESIAPFESLRQRRNGSPVRLLLTISPIKDAAGNVRGVCALVRDITRRRLAERKIKLYQQQLRALASALSFAEQRERRRIAAELHDHLAQMLILSRMKICMLQSTPRPEDTRGPMQEIQRLLDESIDYTRTLIWDLCPPMLHEVGLEAALEWLAEQMHERHGIDVRFEDDEKPKATEENVRVLLFHAVHELLMNVIKHAKASRVIVAVRRQEEQVEIHVEDDGVGFDEVGKRKRVGQGGGFGLFSIRERLDVIGGAFEMKSKPGEGSRATLRAPLQPAAEAATPQQALVIPFHRARR